MRLLRLLAAVMMVASLVATLAVCEEGKLAHRWLFVFRDLNDEAKYQDTLRLLPRAQKAGYNAIVVSDRNLYRLDRAAPSYLANMKSLQATAAFYGLEFIPICMPMGYAGGLLDYDRNLAEGLPVKDALFVAHNGVLEMRSDPLVSLVNAGFEEADGAGFAAWAWIPGSATTAALDADVCHSGKASLRMTHPETGRCGLTQSVKVSPFRQYHLSVWIKTENLGRPGRASLLISAGGADGRQLSFTDTQVQATQEWTRYQIVFNSLDSDQIAFTLGLGRGKGGAIWWDDLALEEIGLVNVLRRAGCPLSVRGEDGRVYEEGRDFAPIRDPALDPYDVYHQPPVVRLTADSRIREGGLVRISYYHPVLIHTDQVVGCLSDPMVYELQRAQVRRINDLLHPKAFFMQHDEIRVANWDQVCQSRGLTPGQLLADNVKRCTQIIHEVSPEAKIWVWSDMFDPMHNAQGDYYLVNGSWEGSWEGLTPDIGIVNWAGFLEGKNCKWFADLGHEQVLSGYYDWDDGGDGIAGWLNGAQGVPGVSGAMYTSWQEKFDSIEAWAEKAWGKPE